MQDSQRGFETGPSVLLLLGCSTWRQTVNHYLNCTKWRLQMIKYLLYLFLWCIVEPHLFSCLVCNLIHSSRAGKCTHECVFVCITVAKPNNRQYSMFAPDKGFYSSTKQMKKFMNYSWVLVLNSYLIIAMLGPLCTSCLPPSSSPLIN